MILYWNLEILNVLLSEFSNGDWFLFLDTVSTWVSGRRSDDENAPEFVKRKHAVEHFDDITFYAVCLECSSKKLRDSIFASQTPVRFCHRFPQKLKSFLC